MSCTSLFIGHTYIDVTLLADHWPTGDEKSVASDYAVSFGGNAVTAAFACAKLGSAPDLICSMAPDWLGHMYADMAPPTAWRCTRARCAGPRCPASCPTTASAPSCAPAMPTI